MSIDPPPGADETAEDGGTGAIERDDGATVEVPVADKDDAAADVITDDGGVPE